MRQGGEGGDGIGAGRAFLHLGEQKLGEANMGRGVLVGFFDFLCFFLSLSPSLFYIFKQVLLLLDATGMGWKWVRLAMGSEGE